MSARAPFVHASSSADLTSPDLISPERTFSPLHPTTAAATATSPPSNIHAPIPILPNGRLNPHHQWQSRPMEKKDSGDSMQHHHNYLAAPGPYYRSNAPTPSRSPSPRPFAVPRFTVPHASTIRFVSLCILWYSCSALSSNTGKVILNNFRFPVTLTIVQFFFVAGLCYLCSRPELGWTTRIRSPTQSILRGTFPMAVFQVGGHIFSSLAISRVPVSTVHTIKALSPLFTVLAYALLFGVSYSLPTYISLLPLTFGVMLATSVDFSLSNIFGLFCAFGSTIVFVSQNIFFKKIMPTNAESTNSSARLDKINLLFYSSGTAFVLMVPLWLYSDALRILNHTLPPNAPSITLYFFLNGCVHFAQNLLAFAILSSTSPVTYSIASLVKRIAVICLAIVWFKQSVHIVQAAGICLTGVGLWMYNNAKRDVEKGEKKMRQVEAIRDGILPISLDDQRTLDGGDIKMVHASPKPTYSNTFLPSSKSSSIRKFDIPTNNLPYPSPPPSTTSSPPDHLISLPASGHHQMGAINMPAPPTASMSRQRRMSNDPSMHQPSTPHVGHSSASRPPPIIESPPGVLAT